VVITAADGKIVTLTPNAAGNFYYQGAVATPFRARVTYMGRERAMGQAQTNGDCNSCHTQNGANQAPGRILLP
jgi:mono/diheme cytochrome c family protein